MKPRKVNPAPLAKATGLGNVVHGQAIDPRADTAHLAHLQADWLRRRTRLSAATARLIAELAFATSPTWVGRRACAPPSSSLRHGDGARWPGR